jgi:predicted MFS family arabinose efflux permease
MPHDEPTPTPHRISRTQWRSGAAAWLGWMFDGLDMHLYTLVATAFVAQLLATPSSPALATDAPEVKFYSGIIQAAFLVGWALGGAFFGLIGDRLGRSRALALTILTYALFTGLGYFAATWWHLLIFRFVAALGIGGEWAVGASLLAETWPRTWRPWLAAVLQTGVNLGVLTATLIVMLMQGLPERTVFLVGVIPAFMVFWIRRSVPETAEWTAARSAQTETPRLRDLFRPKLRRITCTTIAVCATALTAHWAFMFWSIQHVKQLAAGDPTQELTPARAGEVGLLILMAFSIVGNFWAGGLAKRWGYRTSAIAMCLLYFGSMALAYSTPRSAREMIWWFPMIGFSQGLFALFTMYLPSLFPTLLRTTGAGFCYNIGRIAAAAGTVVFGVAAVEVDYRTVLFATAFLFLPAAGAAMLLPEPKHDATPD